MLRKTVLIGVLALSSVSCSKVINQFTDISSSAETFKVSLDTTEKIELTEGSSVVLVLYMSKGRNKDSKINYRLRPKSAHERQEFKNVVKSTWISKGAMSTQLVVSSIDDNVYEGDVEYTLVADSDDTGIDTHSLSLDVLIKDNDQPPVISFTTASQNVLESSGLGYATLQLSNPSAFPITVNYTVGDSGTTNGSDYTAASGAVTFAALETSKNIEFTITQDTTPEASEAFTISLDTINGVASLGSTAIHTASIIDDDVATLAVNSSSVSEGATASFTVSLSVASISDVTFQYATVSGSAAAGTDFTSTTGTGTILAGQLSTVITVPTAHTAGICAADRDFTLHLSSPSANASLGVADGVGTIHDVDLPTVSVAAANAVEGSIINIPATLSVACPTKNVSITWSTSNATATAPSRYIAVASQTNTIVAGQTSVNLPVTTVADAIYQGTQTLGVTISSPVNATLASASAVATINDDETVPTVSFASATLGVSEGDGAITLTVNQSGASAYATSIPYSVNGASTASSGTDYTIAASPLTIAAGQTSASISITLVENATVETAETIVVVLGTPTDATLGATTTETVTINDNDLGTFTISGITGGSDVTADSILGDGVNATVNWDTSTNATSYDVTIYQNDGTTVECALQNTANTNFAFSSCALTPGQTYKAKVTSKLDSVTLNASNSLYSFQFNRAPTPVDDGPLFVMSNGTLTLAKSVFTANDTDPDGDTLSVASVGNGTNGTAVISGANIVYTPSSGYAGPDSFVYTVTDPSGVTATATVSIAVVTAYTWTGAISANWNVAGNWCGSINAGKTACVGTGTVPGASDIAIFDATCAGNTSCSSTSINASASVAGLKLGATYVGTLTQAAGQTLTIGSSGYSQSNGTFAGGNSAIGINGPFRLTAGVFTSTSGTLTYDQTTDVGWFNAGAVFQIPAAVTFNHHNGTIVLTNSGAGAAEFDIDDAHVFWNLGLRYSRGDMWFSYSLTAGKTIHVANDLTFGHTSSSVPVSIQGTGTIEVKGNVIVTNGAFGGTGVVLLNGTGNQTYTGVAGALLSTLTIDKTSGTVTPAAGVVNFGVNSFNLLHGSFTAPSGTFVVQPESWPVNAGNLTVASGTTFTHNSGLVQFTTDMPWTPITIDIPSSQPFWNLGLRYTRGDQNVAYTISQTVTVANDLTVGHLTSGGVVNVTSGTIDLKGNVILTNNAWGGAGVIHMNGTGNQTYTGVANSILPTLTIEKASGTVTPEAGTTDFGVNSFSLIQGSFTAPSGTFLIQPESWPVNSGNFWVGNGTTYAHNSGLVRMTTDMPWTPFSISILSSSSFWNLDLRYTRGDTFVAYNLDSGATVVVENDLTIGHLTSGGVVNVNNGTLKVNGHLTGTTGASGGSSQILFDGTNNETVTVASGATLPSGNVTINKAGGTVTLASHVAWSGVSQALTLTQGTVDMSGFDLTVGSNLTITAGTINKSGGTLKRNTSVTVPDGAYGGGTIAP